VVVMVLGAVYARYGHTDMLGGMFGAIAAAAAGLMVAMAAKMVGHLLRQRSWTGPVFAILAFVALGLLRWPLPWVLAVLAPASVYAALKLRGR
jgi:chromate transporter